jgi:hypothetical protein
MGTAIKSKIKKVSDCLETSTRKEGREVTKVQRQEKWRYKKGIQSCLMDDLRFLACPLGLGHLLALVFPIAFS